MKWFTRFTKPMLDYWRGTTNPQRMLFVVGTTLFGSMVVHGIALVAMGGSINGPVSFRKAMTFAETLWLTCWAIGWMLPFYSFRRRAAWGIAGFVSVFALVETFLMSMQVWRGVPSHYNFTSLFNMVVYEATGIGAIIFSGFMLSLLVRSFRGLNATPSIALSIRTGLLVTLFGSAMGVLMALNNGPVWQDINTLIARMTHSPIGQYTGQPEGTPGGSIILLHALGVHGLQLLPLIGWLLTYSHLSEQNRTRLVGAAFFSLTSLLAVISMQTFRGLSLTQWDAPTLGALMIAGLATLASYAATGIATWRGLKFTDQAALVGPMTQQGASL